MLETTKPETVLYMELGTDLNNWDNLNIICILKR